MHEDAHPFTALTPETVIAAVEATGRVCDLRLFPLNSFENRVWQVGVEGAAPVVAKFYRPGRWSEAAILEEHAFTLELAEAEIPVVAPLPDAAGQTLHAHGPFRFALFERVGGHQPELDDPATLLTLGRILGRLHALGASARFAARPAVDIESYARASHRLLLEGHMPDELRNAYDSLCRDLIVCMERRVQECPATAIRCHADLHPGNILSRDGCLWLVDLDDCRSAPAIQDLWMLLSGERAERTAQLAELAGGYEEFRDFPHRELGLVEVLRTLRIMHHAAWLAARWDDPAFPRHFPWFGTPRFWSGHVLALREQLAALDEEPLRLLP
jgi:Ser/Thr protein kinase RdoA (MazF antagonist)